MASYLTKSDIKKNMKKGFFKCWIKMLFIHKFLIGGSIFNSITQIAFLVTRLQNAGGRQSIRNLNVLHERGAWKL